MHTPTTADDTRHRFFLPHDDLVFKDIFADPNDLEPARAFLAAALGLPPDELSQLELMDPTLRLDNTGHRHIIFDVRLRTTGANIDIEIQLLNSKDFPQRLTHYAAALLIAGLAPGQRYNEARKAICVAVTDFDLTGNNAYASTHQMCNINTGEPLTDIIEIDLLELPKLPATSDGTPIWGWLQFLAAKTRKDLDMAATIDPVIDQAARKVLAFNDDEIKRELAWREWKQIQAEQGREDYVREQGIEQGIEQGRQEVARAMLTDGFAPSRVAQLTGLTAEQVAALA